MHQHLLTKNIIWINNLCNWTFKNWHKRIELNFWYYYALIEIIFLIEFLKIDIKELNYILNIITLCLSQI